MSENHEKLHDPSLTEPESVMEMIGEPTRTQSAPSVQESEWKSVFPGALLQKRLTTNTGPVETQS